MDQLIALFKNDTFWALLTTGLVYLSGVWIRPLVVKLPKTNVVFRLIRLIHLGLNKVDPEGNAPTKATTIFPLLVALAGLSSLTQTACTASFEEARLSGTTPARATATRNDSECQAIDRRHRIWGGVEYGALAVTGASGLSTIPVKDDTGKAALAITAALFAATAAVSKFEDGEATKAWAEQCAAK